MKINREQIVLLVTVLIIGYLAYSLGGSTAAKPRRGRPKARTSVEQEEVVAQADLAEALLPDARITWNANSRNVYRAPTEEEPLPPLSLPAPPRSVLPVGAPQPMPGIDPFHRAQWIKPLQTVKGVEMPARDGEDDAAAIFGNESSDGGDEGETMEVRPETPPADDQEKPQTALDRKRLSLRDRLQRDRLQKIQAERAEQADQSDETARLKLLDSITWTNGDKWHGRIVNDARLAKGADGYDRYGLKLAIDAIRSDSTLSEAERQAKLQDRELLVRFRQKDGSRLGRQQTLSAQNVLSLGFAQTPVNKFELLRRTIPATEAKKHLSMATDLMEVAEYPLAREHLRWMIDQGHDGREVILALADASNRSFEYELEFRALDDAISRYSTDPIVLASRARVLSRFGLDELARIDLVKALDKSPRSARVNATLGRHLMSRTSRLRGDAERAIAILEAATASRLDTSDESRDALYDLGRAQLRVGRLDDARRTFERVHDTASDWAPIQIALRAVDILKAQKDGGAMIGSARMGLETLLEDQPLSGAAWYDLALCDLAEGRWVAARDHLQDAMTVDPLISARCLLAMGYLHERLGDPANALIRYIEAHETDKADPWVRAMLGRGYMLNGDHAKAKEILVVVLGELPGQVDVLISLSDVSFHLNEYDSSLKYLDEALVQMGDPTAAMLIRRGNALMKTGRNDDAKLVLEQAKKIQEGDLVDLSQAHYYYEIGNFDESLRRFRSVVRELDKKDHSPVAEYARLWEAAIADNLAKLVWTDPFNRRVTGSNLLRGWGTFAPNSGIGITVTDGKVSFRGRQRQSDTPTTIYQKRRANEFVSFEAVVGIDKSSPVVCGIGILDFRTAREQMNVYIDKETGAQANQGILLGRTPQGKVAYRVIQKWVPSRWQVLPGVAWVADAQDGGVRLGISLLDPKKNKFDLSVNGQVVARGVEVKGLTRSRKELQLWAFTQAEIDRQVNVTYDDVRVVRREMK